MYCIRSFGVLGILGQDQDAGVWRIKCVQVCGKDIDILWNFIYLSSVVQNNGILQQQVLKQIGLA